MPPWEVYQKEPSSLPVPAPKGPWQRYDPMANAQPAPSIPERLGQSAYSTGVGITQGVTAGAYDELASLIGTPIKAGERLMTGQDSIEGAGDILPFLGRSFNSALEGQRALTSQAYEQAPLAAAAGDVAGSVALGNTALKSGVTFLNAATKPNALSMGLRAAGDAGVYGAVRGFNSGDDLESRTLGAIEGGAISAAVGGVFGSIAGTIAGKQAASAAGTIDDVKGQATALYDAARNSGAQLGPNQAKAMSDSMRMIADGEGIITPMGRINDSFPKLKALIQSFDDYGSTGKPLDVRQMQAIRGLISNALKSPDADERRIAMAMMDEFHKFLDPISPQIAQANSLYHSAMNAQELQTAVDIAKQQAEQYGRPLEQTLKAQFGVLERQILKGELRGFSPAEQKAISLVARGGNLQNALSWVGKATPRGPVSWTAGASVPFGLTYAVTKDPFLAGSVAAGVTGSGAVASKAASGLSDNSARQAIIQSLMGQAQPQANAAISPIVRALISAEASQSPKMDIGLEMSLRRALAASGAN